MSRRKDRPSKTPALQVLKYATAVRLQPGMSVSEARKIVSQHPDLILVEIDADAPFTLAWGSEGRIDVYVRGGVLVSEDDIAE